MTHGEEPGPETHKDSAVLTYLEGLLMHPVVAGPGAAASRRSEAAHSNQEQADKAGGPFLPPGRGPAAPRPNGPSSLGASQHLKKARLLRSGAWSEAGSQRTATPPAMTAAAAQLNGHQGAGGQNGALGEGTLLASLLQSFSSRLQSVALSQHAAGEPPGEQRSPPPTASAAEPAPAAYGTASSRLKGLMRKSKAACHSGTPYTRRVAAGQGQDRPPESSPPPASPAAAASEAGSCAERLKAVANMVKIRSSPAPSPKPSLACSQLALLLSSEAHLQQYSREHALKARLSGRSASERLAAMATQQQVGGTDKRPPSAGDPPPAAPPPPLPDALGGFPAQNGTATRAPAPAAALPGQRSPSLQRGGPNQTSPLPPSPQHAPRHTHTLSHAPSHALSHTRTLTNNPGQLPREKRAFDSRPSRPPQTCSSLLLLLLNNHNSQRQLTKNGHLEEDNEEEEEEEEGRGEDGGGGSGLLLPPPSCSSSVTSDSECSAQERSLAKDSDDAESSYSSCSPIDLSVRSRGAALGPKTSSSSSSSSTTSSSLSSSAMFSSARAAFSPPPCVHPSLAASSSCSSAFSGPSLDKMTESLINKWKPEACGGSKVVPRAREEPEPHPKLTLMQLLLERRNTDRAARSGDLPLDVTMATMSVPPGPRGGAGETRTPSPYSHPSPGVQSSPLDLCKSKAAAAEPAFSASKLLQNLAQCGVASASPSPPACRAPETVLLERLGGPVLHRSTATTPLSDGPSASGTPLSRGTGGSPPAILPPPSSSQIENLLERRTVLQLLLGTGSTTTTTTAAVATAAICTRQDRAGGGRGGAEQQAGNSERHPALCDSSNGPSADVKVKTERQEEASEDFNGRKRRGWGGGGKTSPVPSELPADFKTEQPPPRPTEVVAKYGLLSQLLKQQTATYYASAATQPQPRQVKEELLGDCRGPSPKKRLLCPDRAAGDGLGLVSTFQEEPRHRRTPKEAGAGAAAPARSPPTNSPARESRGFNVLKQLLLSDNCLKELSQQPRAACSSSALQANGHPVIAAPVPSQPSHNHSFLHPSWQPHPSLSLGLHGNLRPLPNTNTNNNNTNNNNNSSSSLPGDAPLRFPWDHHPAPWAVSQKRDAPILVKQEPESPVRWSGQEDEDEGGDSNRDSPRLTRSNPILYYMLQKGSAQLRRELRDQAEGARPAACVKEEPIGDTHTYEHRLSSAPHSPPPHSDKHSRKSHGLSQSSE